MGSRLGPLVCGNSQIEVSVANSQCKSTSMGLGAWRANNSTINSSIVLIRSGDHGTFLLSTITRLDFMRQSQVDGFRFDLMGHVALQCMKTPGFIREPPKDCPQTGSAFLAFERGVQSQFRHSGMV